MPAGHECHYCAAHASEGLDQQLSPFPSELHSYQETRLNVTDCLASHSPHYLRYAGRKRHHRAREAPKRDLEKPLSYISYVTI